MCRIKTKLSRLSLILNENCVFPPLNVNQSLETIKQNRNERNRSLWRLLTGWLSLAALLLLISRLLVVQF